MKKLFNIIILMTLITLMGGCKGDFEEKQVKKDVPSIDKYDSNMSQAHFISAPDFFEYQSLDNDMDVIEWKQIGFTAYLNGQDISLALSDGRGQYGSIGLFTFRDTEDGLEISAGSMENGFHTSSDDTYSYSNKKENYRIVIANCVDTVKISVDDTEIAQLDSVDFDVKSYGFYKERKQTSVYVDDFKIVGADDKIICQNDFNDNNTDIFEPYYMRAKDGKLEITSGLILTRLEGAPAPLFRRSFVADKSQIENAYLYMTALGAYDVELNGNKISDDYLATGNIFFNDHLNYSAYDISDYIEKNNNLEIILYHGWYDRAQGYPEAFRPSGDKLALKGEVILELKNGDVKIISTDELFEVSYDTAIRYDDIYHGEIVELSYLKKDMSYVPVQVDEVDEKYLSLDIEELESPNIVSILKLAPVSCTSPKDGVYVYDFGQNFSGNISLDLTAFNIADVVADDDPIVIRYGETINSDFLYEPDDDMGCIYTANLLTAKATDYILGAADIKKDSQYAVGIDSKKIEFRATVHGFRYVQIEGISEAIPNEAISANLLSSPMEDIGSFTSSNEVLNRFYENAKFSVLSNSLTMLTDCNQRDERLPWSGDAQAVSEFLTYTLDSRDILNKFVKYMCLCQDEDGAFYDTAPSRIYGEGINVWGDAPLVIAWNLYLQYGNKDIITDYYDNYARWVDYLVATSDDYLRVFDGYGDHLSLQETNLTLSNTAWCAHSAEIMSKMARVIGESEDEKKYRDIYEEYRKAWQGAFISENPDIFAGILTEESETAYALGIMFGLFDDDMMQMAADRLSMLADYSDYIFYPGYSGLNCLLPALTEYSHADTAMNLLEKTDSGSLLFTVGCGLTTTPESLQSITINDGKLDISGSLNHFAYGSVCSYLYKYILGIQSDEEHPGYEHFYLRPLAIGTLTFARGSYKTDYGIIEVDWKLDDATGQVTYSCTIPDNSTCTLVLPDGSTRELEQGSYTFNYSS